MSLGWVACYVVNHLLMLSVFVARAILVCDVWYRMIEGVFQKCVARKLR